MGWLLLGLVHPGVVAGDHGGGRGQDPSC
jgi:hypothetical protein